MNRSQRFLILFLFKFFATCLFLYFKSVTALFDFVCLMYYKHGYFQQKLQTSLNVYKSTDFTLIHLLFTAVATNKIFFKIYKRLDLYLLSPFFPSKKKKNIALLCRITVNSPNYLTPLPHITYITALFILVPKYLKHLLKSKHAETVKTTPVINFGKRYIIPFALRSCGAIKLHKKTHFKLYGFRHSILRLKREPFEETNCFIIERAK